MVQTKKIIELILIILDIFLASFLIISTTHAYPVRYAEAPRPGSGDISYFFNENLTRMIRNASTLDVNVVVDRNYTFQGVPINEKRLFYISEIISEGAVRVNAILLKPLDVDNPPVLVFQHGYGQSWSDFYFLFKIMVAEGKFAVFAIDAPDCGNSSRLISKDPKNLLNISNGPEGSYIFHEAIAIMRGITYLTEVEGFSKVIMSGVSMGGIQTFIITAVDYRVIAGIPIIATGNFLNVLGLPRLSQGMVIFNPNEKDIVKNFLKWFDLVHFARNIRKPILYMMDTEDEYFDLISANDTFNALATNNKRFVVFPNGDHMGIPWVMNAIWNIINWVKYLKNETSYPQIEEVKIETLSNPLFTEIKLRVRVLDVGDNKVVVYFRNSNPLEFWKRVEARKVGDNVYEVEIVSFSSPLISFFVAVEDADGKILVSSQIYQKKSSYGIIILAFIISLFATIYVIWPIEINKEIIKVSSLSLAYFAIFELPIFAILGRGQWSVWDIMEVYKILLGASPPFFYVTLFLISISPVLAYYKERAFHILYFTSFLIVVASISGAIIIEFTTFAYYLSWDEFPIFYGYGIFVSIALYMLPYVEKIRKRIIFLKK